MMMGSAQAAQRSTFWQSESVGPTKQKTAKSDGKVRYSLSNLLSSVKNLININFYVNPSMA
jgi:hypothetical protein